MIKRLREWWKWRKHQERAAWHRWQKLGGRCPGYCFDLSVEDWLALCDCWEAERCLKK